jgi:hypothetical protein
VLAENNRETGSELAVRNADGAIEVSRWNAGSEFLNKRSFKGLEPKIGETEVQFAVEGRSGIPKQYDGEGNSQSNP